jgi:hypothetical protein
MPASREPATTGMISCSLILMTLAAIAPIAAHGQSKTQNVNVVNPTSNPVNTRITNTVVPIEVSNADPIPVDARESVSAVRVRWLADHVIGGLCDNTGYTVPAGKTLIVEYAHVNGPPGGVFQVLFSSSAGVNVFLAPAAHYEIADLASFSQQMTFYVFAGETVRMSIGREASATVGNYNCIFMGRLIDAT